MGTAIYAIVLLIASIIARGFALMVLWEWLIRSTFNNAPELGMASAIGLSIFTGYLIHVPNQKPETNKEEQTESEIISELNKAFFRSIVNIAVFIGMAYVVTLFLN